MHCRYILSPRGTSAPEQQKRTPCAFEAAGRFIVVVSTSSLSPLRNLTGISIDDVLPTRARHPGVPSLSMLHVIPASPLGVPPSPLAASFGNMDSSLPHTNHMSSQHTAPPPPPRAPIFALHGRLLTFLALPPTARSPDLDGARGSDTLACTLSSSISCFFSRSALASAAGPSVRSPAEALASGSSAWWISQEGCATCMHSRRGARPWACSARGVAHGLEVEVSARASSSFDKALASALPGADYAQPPPVLPMLPDGSPPSFRSSMPVRALVDDISVVGFLDEEQAAMRAEAERRKGVAIAEARAGRSRKKRAAVWIVNLDRCFLTKSLAFPQQRAHSANSWLEYIKVSRPLYSSAVLLPMSG
ncbi:hypothetical protein FB451DRAFT_1402612 [Mycena latifolia]|nr:hypothetical protein FB451DRAFT_1402612 [Mycena latifolia]